MAGSIRLNGTTKDATHTKRKHQGPVAHLAKLIWFIAAFDFKRENLLKGFSVGAGHRWRSANILGTNPNGDEIEGRSIRETDFMLRYVRRLKPCAMEG